MRVAVYGAGGVGGYFGGRLAQAGADVHLIARGEHLAALRSTGLRVRSVLGDFELRMPATQDPAAIGTCDFVLFCVKSFDTEKAAAHLSPMIGEDTAVISLQNGIDNEEKIAARVGQQHVMGGVAYIFSTVGDPGVIEHSGGPSRFSFGEMEGSTSIRAKRFSEIARKAGISGEPSKDIRRELWEKFAFICAIAGMTAAVRLPLQEIWGTPETREMFLQITREVVDVARAEGMDLGDAVQRSVALAEALPGDVYSSLHYDLTHGKPMELEALHGALLERARANGISTPASQAIYSILRSWAIYNGRLSE